MTDAIQKAREALREMIYETTHLSPEEADGAHKCIIPARALSNARSALAALDAETEGWRTMDIAPKDGTIVNVVARYPDATAGFPRYAGFNEEMGCWVEYSRHLPEPVVPLVWRPRGEWPQFSEARS